MVTLSLPKGQQYKKTTFVILVGCDVCGEIHVVEFADKNDFLNLRCRRYNSPIFYSRRGYKKVWQELHRDLRAECLNAKAA